MTNITTDKKQSINQFSAKSVIKAMFLSALLLTCFGILGTFSVSSVYKVTSPLIEKNIQKKLLQMLGSVIPETIHDNNLLNSTIEVAPSSLLSSKDKTTIYQAKLNNKVTAIAFKTTAPDGYSGNISLLVGVLKSGQITAIRVISHKETPGLGDKVDVERSEWIHSFEKTSLDTPDKAHWKVKKDGGYFDQFTGATITPRAVVKASYKALIYVDQHKQLLFELNE